MQTKENILKWGVLRKAILLCIVVVCSIVFHTTNVKADVQTEPFCLSQQENTGLVTLFFNRGGNNNILIVENSGSTQKWKYLDNSVLGDNSGGAFDFNVVTGGWDRYGYHYDTAIIYTKGPIYSIEILVPSTHARLAVFNPPSDKSSPQRINVHLQGDLNTTEYVDLPSKADDNQSHSNSYGKKIEVSASGIRTFSRLGTSFSVNSFARTGYTLTKWHGPIGNWHADTQTYWMYPGVRDDVCLYYSANTYTLHFNANGGTAARSSQTAKYNSQWGGLPGASRTGYSFQGWYDGNTRVDWNTICKGDRWVTAHWTPNQYVFDLQGGSIEHGTADVYVNGRMVANDVRDWYQSYNYGSTITVTDIRPDTGYHNAGAGSYSQVLGTSGWTCNVDIRPNTYTVAYNKNDGSGYTMPNSTATYNANFVTRKNEFSETGYDFDGWNERADGNGTAWRLTSPGVYENGNGTRPWKWTYTSNITLYAQWRYHVRFDGNAPKDVNGNTLTVTGSVASMDSLYSGHNYALNRNQFNVYGYEFIGWSPDKNSTSPQYADGGTISFNPTPNNGSTVTLYAIWKISSYPITYKIQTDSNAETDMPETVSLANKKTVIYPAHGGLYFGNPRLTNEKFTGWTCTELGIADKTKDLTVSSAQIESWYNAKGNKSDNVGITMVAHFEEVPPYEFVDEKTGQTPVLNETEKNQGKFRIEEIESSPGYIYEDQYHDIDIRDNDDTHEYQDSDYRNLTFPDKNGK